MEEQGCGAILGTGQDDGPIPTLSPLLAGTRRTRSLGPSSHRAAGAVLPGRGPLFDFLPRWHAGGWAGCDLFALRSRFPLLSRCAIPWKSRDRRGSPRCREMLTGSTDPYGSLETPTCPAQACWSLHQPWQMLSGSRMVLIVSTGFAPELLPAAKPNQRSLVLVLLLRAIEELIRELVLATLTPRHGQARLWHSVVEEQTPNQGEAIEYSKCSPSPQQSSTTKGTVGGTRYS